MDHGPPGSSVHGILQARVLEWVAMPSSRGSSPLRVQTCIPYSSCIAGGFFPSGKPLDAAWGTRKKSHLIMVSWYMIQVWITQRALPWRYKFVNHLNILVIATIGIGEVPWGVDAEEGMKRPEKLPYLMTGSNKMWTEKRQERNSQKNRWKTMECRASEAKERK